MSVVSVNVGRPEQLTVGANQTMTGINKRPARGSVWISYGAVGNDVICDLDHHGGLDQAVYAYSSDDYDWWSEELGREIAPGTFGENLTIDGLATELFVGDRLLIGDLVLEATAPRIPCNTLAAQMREKSFGMVFRHAERPGSYFRVMNEGEVAVGDRVELIDNPERKVSIIDLFRFAYELNPDANDMQRYLDAPVAERMRAKIEKKLSPLIDA